MDDNLMKQILENNSKLNSMAKAILVRWKWDDNKHYRIFLGLRHGGTRETQFDLDQKYPVYSDEKIIGDIIKTMTDLADIVYFSARKLSSSRGGGICTNDRDIYQELEALIPLFEGFLTYGGISVREIESMAVGLYETLDETMIRQSPDFIAYLVNSLDAYSISTVKPAGVLGAHVNAMEICDHIPQKEYPAGALAAALYLISGVRGMERGTLSNQRDEYGNETLADMELVRLAVPRRVFTLSQIKYVADRMAWLYDNRKLIGGLRFVYEPPVLRFFMGGLEPVSDWPQKLIAKFKEDFGESL
jgi:tyrosine phenol-lyase